MKLQISKQQIISTGFVFHLLAAYFSIGYHQCDELFQVFEFAGYKLGLNNAADMPWEFAAQMRSGIQPLVVYLATKLLHFLSITNPFHVALFLRMIMAVFSFLVIKKFLEWAELELTSEKLKMHLWAFGLLFWCLPYFHARLSSENFSSLFFILGLNALLNTTKQKSAFFNYGLAGLAFGIAFVCRFQFAFMIAGLIAWLIFIKKPQKAVYLYLALGLIVALAFNLLVDKWFYNKWVLSWWNYLEQNLFEDKASAFGKSPFYFYLAESLLQLIPPFSLIIVFALIGFWWKFRSHVLTWLSLPFVLLHFFVAHKELRFLFPVLNFLPIITLLFLQNLNKTDSKLIKFLSSLGFINFAIIVNVLLLCFFTFKPADDISKSLERIYSLVQGKSPTLFYEQNNPYNKAACLNYFVNPNIKTLSINDAIPVTSSESTYLLTETFNSNDTLVKQGKTFVKIYSNFPSWFSKLNFNGWLDRAYAYNIYKLN